MPRTLNHTRGTSLNPQADYPFPLVLEGLENTLRSCGKSSYLLTLSPPINTIRMGKFLVFTGAIENTHVPRRETRWNSMDFSEGLMWDKRGQGTFARETWNGCMLLSRVQYNEGKLQ